MDHPSAPGFDAAPKRVQFNSMQMGRRSHMTGPDSVVRDNQQDDWDVPVFNPAGEEEING